MDKISNVLLAIATGVIGLAIVAVIVGKNAQTSNVITSGGNAFASIIKAAVGPVS